MTDDSATSTLAKQSGITFVGKLVGRTVSFLFIIVVTRLVTPSVYGTFTLALAIVKFSQELAGLNLYKAIDYFIPEQLNNKDYSGAKSVLMNVLIMASLGAVVGTIVIVTMSETMSRWFNDPSLGEILPFMALGIPLGILRSIGMTFFGGIKELKYRVYMKNIVQNFGRLIITTSLLLSGVGIIGLVVGHLLAVLLAVLVGGFFIVKSSKWVLSEKVGSTSRSDILSYSLPLMFAGIIFATLGQIDYFVIGYFSSSSDVGVYRVSFLLSSNLWIFLSATTPVFKPLVSESKNDTKALKSRYQLATRWVTILTIPAAVTLVIAPKIYLSLLFTTDFAVASTVVTVLSIGYLLNACFGPEGMVLEGLGYTRITFLNTVIMIVVNAGLDIFLVPRIGVVGASIGTASALTIAGLAGVLEIKYLRKIHPYNRTILKVWSSTIPIVLLGLGIKAVLKSDILIALTLPPSILLAYVLLLKLTSSFEEEDKMIADKIDSKIGYQIFGRVVN